MQLGLSTQSIVDSLQQALVPLDIHVQDCDGYFDLGLLDAMPLNGELPNTYAALNGFQTVIELSAWARGCMHRGYWSSILRSTKAFYFDMPFQRYVKKDVI